MTDIYFYFLFKKKKQIEKQEFNPINVYNEINYTIMRYSLINTNTNVLAS
jgi:hypothetical protein